MHPRCKYPGIWVAGMTCEAGLREVNKIQRKGLMLQNMIRIENAQKDEFLKIFSTMFNASSSEVRYYGFLTSRWILLPSV